MSDRVEKLKGFENRWETAMGAWFPGERVVFRGQDLHKDLSELSYSQILYLAACGRLYKGGELFFMDTANTVCSSFPDPRIWNNRIGALAGSVRSPASLAIAAATAVSDASVYGGKTQLRAQDFLHRAMEKREFGETIEEIVRFEFKTYRSMAGFGRPVTNRDERIESLLENAKKAGIEKGKHLNLAFEIEDFLFNSRRRFKLNVNGILGAISADLGNTPKEFYLFCLTTFTAGILACYVDAIDHDEGAFFPFSVQRINYKGELGTRSW